jgi:galactonate dehydratase
MTAVGALDIALWDIEGKRLGVPVHRLLGGPYRTRLRAYASHWLAGATSPDDVRRGARDIVQRGLSGFKWSPFDPALLRANESRALARATELMAAATTTPSSASPARRISASPRKPRTSIPPPGWLTKSGG